MLSKTTGLNKRLIWWAPIALAVIIAIGGGLALMAREEPRAAVRGGLDTVAARMEVLRPEIEDFATLECLGAYFVFEDCKILYAQAEQAWSAGDFSKANELVVSIEAKLDRLPVGDKGLDARVVAVVAVNGLLGAGAAALVWRNRKKRRAEKPAG